jgi:Ca2+-transporting ATPase
MNSPHATEPWHREDAAAILRSLGTSPETGLGSPDARIKLEQIGANEIAPQRGHGVLRLFAHQFADVMIALLVAAAIVAGWLGDVIDAVAIVVIVALNATVGVIQEYRAQRAIAALRRMSAPTARVLRDGTMGEIPAREVVPGDIVTIEAGDVVPADMRLIDAVDPGMDESALTGESVPVSKTGEVVHTRDPALGERLNMAYKSTLVTRGRATGVVVATGRATEIGRIADMLRGARSARTPLQQRLARFSRRIALVVLAICAIVFATGLLQGQPALLMFMTALSLAVAAVPEALPAVITLALGLGARRLGEKNALVRRLPAVESLGAVTYICADKTGTLTENRMALAALYAGGNEYRELPARLPEPLGQRIGEILALCNDVDAGSMRGEPTELALVEGARAMGFDKQALASELRRVGELPFEAGRRYMVTLHEGPSGPLALVKGAPERVIEGCVDQWVAGGRASITDSLLEAADRMAERGYRVLAIAFRDDLPEAGDIDAAELGHDWTFAGLVGLIDPPRPGALDAIRECRSAGIVPVMITGDHPATARAIAEELEIADASS